MSIDWGFLEQGYYERDSSGKRTDIIHSFVEISIICQGSYIFNTCQCHLLFEGGDEMCHEGSDKARLFFLVIIKQYMRHEGSVLT